MLVQLTKYFTNCYITWKLIALATVAIVTSSTAEHPRRTGSSAWLPLETQTFLMKKFHTLNMKKFKTYKEIYFIAARRKVKYALYEAAMLLRSTKI